MQTITATVETPRTPEPIPAKVLYICETCPERAYATVTEARAQGWEISKYAFCPCCAETV